MSTPAQRRGPYAKSADQRRRILDVAVDVFGRLGNRGSSLREIADKVGMSQAGVLHHFGSKSGLLMAVLEERDQVGAEAGEPDLASQAVRLRGLLEAAVANPGLTQLFVTMSAEATDPEHPARDYVVERYRATVARFTEPMRAAQDEGLIDGSIDTEAVARLVVAAMDGLQLQQLLVDADPLPPFDVLVDALFRAFGAPSADVTDVR